jgi:hypothetical protein
MKYLSKSVGSQEILIPENIIEISNCFTQFIPQLKRNFLPIYRNKLNLLFEYLSGLGVIFFGAFIFTKLNNQKYNFSLDLMEILERNNIYIYEDSSAKGVLKNSYAYDLSKKMTLKALPRKPNSIQKLIDLAYEMSSANIAMGCLSINQIGDIWHTFITKLNLGNLFADIMLLISAFLKKEFGIDAIILNKIKMIEEDNIYQDKNIAIMILPTICMINFYGYAIFLGGLINEKIKERKTKIKHLLYLSGNNSWSYWTAFFVIDYLKLLLFSFFLLIPIH